MQTNRRYRLVRLAIYTGAMMAVFLPFVLQRQVFSHALDAPAPPASHHYTTLSWEQLHHGRWEMDQPPVMPAAIAALSGQPVTATGYLLPMHGAGASADLYLAQTPGGCFFCNPPGIADVILIHVAQGRAIPIVSNLVRVYGRFHAATDGGNDESLYVMFDATVVNAQKD